MSAAGAHTVGAGRCLPEPLRLALGELGVDVDVDVLVSDRAISHAEAPRRGRRGKIAISRDAIAAGGSALLGTLAHEIAHILDPLERRDHALILALTPPLMALAVFALMVYPTIAPANAPRAFVIGIWFAGWPLLFAAFGWRAQINHRRELRVDRAAAQLLGSPEPMMAAIDRVAVVMNAYSTLDRLHAWLTHPSPARRRRALAAPGT